MREGGAMDLDFRHDLQRYADTRQGERQPGIGASNITGCYRQLAYQYHGVPESDPRSTSAADLGTLVHLGWGRIIASQYDPVDRDVEVTLYLDELPRAVTADDVSYTDRVVRDIKGLALNTPLPTPEGWTTMAAVQVGDWLLDMDGRPCRVTAVSQVRMNDCVEVKLSGRSESPDVIVADMEHRWLARIPGRKWAVYQTREMLTKTAVRHLPVAQPLSLPEQALPLDPWLLGYWLGNGDTSAPRVSCGADDAAHVYEMIASAGYQTGNVRYSGVNHDAPTIVVKGMTKVLADMGLLGNKHIPAQYLRASQEQRMALLRGLMDSDGFWYDRRSRCRFDSTNRHLRDQVHELLHSLGQKASDSGPNKQHGWGHLDMYHVEWTPTFVPFALARKAALVKPPKKANQTGAYRVSFGARSQQLTKCVTVDSPTATYLAGRDMVVTHNTAKDAVWQSWLNRGTPYHHYWEQLHVYGLALYRMYGGQWSLCVTAINRETGAIVEYERPFDPEVALALVQTAQRRHESLTASTAVVASGEADALHMVDTFPREGRGPGTGMPCDYCPWLSICWPSPSVDGGTPQSETIREDAEQIGIYATEYLEASAESRKWEQKRKDLQAFLFENDGVYPSPNGGEIKVQMTGGKPTDPVVDCERAAHLLEQVGVEVPMKPGRLSPRWPRVSRVGRGTK